MLAPTSNRNQTETKYFYTVTGVKTAKRGREIDKVLRWLPGNLEVRRKYFNKIEICQREFEEFFW